MGEFILEILVDVVGHFVLLILFVLPGASIRWIFNQLLSKKKNPFNYYVKADRIASGILGGLIWLVSIILFLI
ncbi:MAG: hypothetical protein ABJG50_10180 [Crocinitomicaceae bacterium]